jgi:hypothetical protein
MAVGVVGAVKGRSGGQFVGGGGGAWEGREGRVEARGDGRKEEGRGKEKGGREEERWLAGARKGDEAKKKK